MKKTLQIEGMSCRSCVTLIIDELIETIGITSPVVNLEKNEASFEMDENLIDLETIKKRIDALGFTVHL